LTEARGRYALIVVVTDYRDDKLRNLRAPETDASDGSVQNFVYLV
jgi:hypothetical protein